MRSGVEGGVCVLQVCFLCDEDRGGVDLMCCLIIFFFLFFGRWVGWVVASAGPHFSEHISQNVQNHIFFTASSETFCGVHVLRGLSFM